MWKEASDSGHERLWRCVKSRLLLMLCLPSTSPGPLSICIRILRVGRVTSAPESLYQMLSLLYIVIEA